ncbi:MAG: WzyE family oligosaccharide polymerase [Arsenophonus sp. NC-CH8-MAG3]
MLTYLSVDRARLILLSPLHFSHLLSLVRGWIDLWILIITDIIGIFGMFWLALKRYELDLSGEEAFVFSI